MVQRLAEDNRFVVCTSVADTGAEELSTARDLRKLWRRAVALICFALFRVYRERLSIRWVRGSSARAPAGLSCRWSWADIDLVAVPLVQCD